jgi:hypothetical protein
MNFIRCAKEETKMSYFQCVTSPNIADETVGDQHKGDSVRVPMAKSELFKRPAIEAEHASGDNSMHTDSANSGPMDAADKIASAIAATSDRRSLKFIETGLDVTTMPIDQASAPSSDSSRKEFRISRKGIIITMVLGLATGIAIGGEWLSHHSFIETLKATNLRGAVETIFAGSSKAEHLAADPLPAAAGVHKLSEIPDQLTAIASSLSSVQQSINELAVGQEQIRKAQEQLAQRQEQLAQTQSRFAVSQTQANLKQNTQPSLHSTAGRKLNRRDDVYHPWQYILYGDR